MSDNSEKTEWILIEDREDINKHFITEIICCGNGFLVRTTISIYDDGDPVSVSTNMEFVPENPKFRSIFNENKKANKEKPEKNKNNLDDIVSDMDSDMRLLDLSFDELAEIVKDLYGDKNPFICKNGTYFKFRKKNNKKLFIVLSATGLWRTRTWDNLAEASNFNIIDNLTDLCREVQSFFESD